MPLGQKEFENQPQIQISPEQALQAQFAKVGQLMFQIDILSQHLRAFEQENQKLREQIASLQPQAPAE